MQVAENKMQLATFPASFTGFSTNLLIKDGYGCAYREHETHAPCGIEQILSGEVRAGFWTKKKGCDFGYALADNSCERVPGVDACTVAALDVITAFTVPDLG